MTEQINAEKKIKIEEERKKREMEVLISNLNVAKQKSKNLLGQMLPDEVAERIINGETMSNESFDQCTILFSNIVGFADIAAGAQSIHIVNLLNDLYTYFDSIIDNHGC